MRRHLIEAAVRSVVARGSVVLPIDEFLAQAGVARATFYKYFPDTESVVQAMAHVVSHELIAHLDPMVKHYDDAAERLSAGMLGVLRVVERLPELGRLLTRLGWPLAEVHETHAFYAVVRSDVERGIAKRRFARLELRTAMDLVAGAIIAGAHRLSSEAPPPDLAAQVTAAALRALGVSFDEARALAQRKVDLPPFAAGSVLSILAGERR